MDRVRFSSWRDMRRYLEGSGWELVRGRSRHLKFTHPEYGVFVMPRSSSDYRALRNAEAHFRRVEGQS